MPDFMGRRDRRQHIGDPRLPSGQYDAGNTFPVLTAEVTPQVDPQTWTFRIDGLVSGPRTWTWAQVHEVAPST